MLFQVFVIHGEMTIVVERRSSQVIKHAGQLTAVEGSWKAESASLPLAAALLFAGVELPSQITGSAELMTGLSDQFMVDSLGPDERLKKSTGESNPGLSYPTVVPRLTTWMVFSSRS